MFKNIQKGIKKIIQDAIKDFCEENGFEIYYENGKMMAKIKPSMKNTALKISGSLLVFAAGTGIAGYAGQAFALEELLRNGIILLYEWPLFAYTPFIGGKVASFWAARFEAVIAPFGWFGLLVGGLLVGVVGIGLAMDSFSERKKNYYNESIKNVKERFFSFYNGYEKKILSKYDAIKSKSAEDAASYLNMQYFPVQLDEDQRQNLLNKFEDLQKEINNILSLN